MPIIDVDSQAPLSVRHAFSQHGERSNWIEVSKPIEGDAVLMGKNARPSHIGVWIDVNYGRILHCVEGFGVITNDKSSLTATGWRILGFYRKVKV